jgi:hypothetical protein
MLRYQSVRDDITTALDWLECPYKAPEQFSWAKNLLAKITKELGARPGDLLADPVLLDKKIREYNERNKRNWLGGTLQKTSSNKNVVGEEPIIGYFCFGPEIGKSFEFFHSDSKAITTSPLKSITTSPDGRNLILETTNSTYDLYINKGPSN